MSSPRSPWRTGLSARTSVSGNGAYRVGAAEEVLALPSCVWRGQEFTTYGETPQALFAPLVPSTHSVRQVRRSWTGKAYEYRWSGGDLSLELRTTLPGPLFSTSGRSIRIRAISGCEWRSFSDLEGRGVVLSSISSEALRGARSWVVESRVMPLVLVASQPISAIRIISHMYYEFVFARPSARLLVTPLLAAEDVPRDAQRLALWQELVARPPLHAEERFRDLADDDGQNPVIEIRTRFPGARLSPLPPVQALLGRTGSACGLLSVPPAQTVLRTWCGPYQVVVGNVVECRVAMGWSTAAMRPGVTVGGPLSAIPEELAYAGDATWEPGTVMDQLLALRTWAPLLAAMPPASTAALLPSLTLPSPAALASAVESIREPSSGLRWGRWRQMWDHTGDACYDIDWYNGLGLSGLARAATSGCPAVAQAGWHLARACRRQRAELLNYFSIFSDWALGTAWSDPRGWLWNADCLHNGLEGILAEAELRQREGNQAGAAHARYLAARHAVGLRASLELPAWTDEGRRVAPSAQAAGHRIDRMVTWSGTAGVNAPSEEPPAIGVQALVSWREITYCTTATRNPYVLAGHSPPWNALLDAHTDPAWKRRLAAAFDLQPERYADWITYYIGSDWQERRRRGDQEARVQAAVFYSLAPEIAFRRWVLHESPAAIEARFATPLNLAEQLLLRSAAALTTAAPVTTRRTASSRAPAARMESRA